MKRIIPAPCAIRKHKARPTAAGRTAANTVQRQEPVSFRMVRSVVAQGQ